MVSNVKPLKSTSCSDVNIGLLTNSVVEELLRYCYNSQIEFFIDLPVKKQISLLKSTEDMISVRVDLPYKLTDTLNLPFEDVCRWLNKRLGRNVETVENPKFTAYTARLLNDEFKNSDSVLNYEHALLVGYALKLPTDAIRMWFEREKVDVKYEEWFPFGLDCVGKFKFAGSKSVSLFKPITNFDENPSLSDTGKIIYSSLDELGFSRSLTTIINDRKCNNFFYRLSLPVQIVLLKCARILPKICRSMVDKIANRLDVSVFQLIAWLSVVHHKYSNIQKKRFTPSLRNAVLNDEFALSQILSDERVLLLSYILEIPFNNLREWFDNRRIHEMLAKMTVDQTRGLYLQDRIDYEKKNQRLEK